ncbi:hypothetical protein DBV15_12726 [Temnothorax longispinosus]|uniref:Uncharacterized protein n=1 Tax=Temnothorax longispinosus TaxID=300112 RepID=A0A4S2L0F7_9HYME|nr:hypothetical protein DBV15_12726 [Temnothorax longispinosus]
MPGVDGTDPGVLPEAHRHLQNDLLQEHGARAALAGVRPKADHRHPADHRIRQNGPWIHEALAGRPDCFIKGRFLRVGCATNEQVPRSPAKLRPIRRHLATAGGVLYDGYGGNEACFLRVRAGQKHRRAEAHRN